jgi:hypothetical protein
MPPIISKAFRYARNYVDYLNDWRRFGKLQALANDGAFPLAWGNRMPALGDKSKETKFDGHYVYHCAWAIRTVLKIQPSVHFDISSSLYFSTALSAWIPVKFFDYRPATINLSQLECDRCDLTHLAFEDNSIKSLSCMHTLEHVGLGRYGDTLDPAGHLKAIGELKRVVAPEGSLLVVVPVGAQRVCFNAHRIYRYEFLLDLFAGFELVEAALVTDNNEFVKEPTRELCDKQQYGCGCFWFKKTQS